MKAVKFYGVGNVHTVDTEAVTPRNNQALIRVLYGGICGSDLHIYRKGMFVERLEEITGHEFVGQVYSAPAENELNEGDLVVGDPWVPCGRCPACLEGDSHRCASLGSIKEVRPRCFAEYLALEPRKLIVPPKDTDLKRTALCGLLAVAIRACKEIMRANPKHVLVAGAGPINLLVVCLLETQYQVAQATVADLDEFRRSEVEQVGTNRTVSDGFKAGGTFDCAVDTVGIRGALEGTVQVIHPDGSIFISAIYETLPIVDVNYLVSNEQKLCGDNAYSFSDLQEATWLIGGKTLILNWLVTRVLPADQVGQAFRLLATTAKTDLKILLDFRI